MPDAVVLVAVLTPDSDGTSAYADSNADSDNDRQVEAVSSQSPSSSDEGSVPLKEGTMAIDELPELGKGGLSEGGAETVVSTPGEGYSSEDITSDDEQYAEGEVCLITDQGTSSCQDSFDDFEILEEEEEVVEVVVVEEEIVVAEIEEFLAGTLELGFSEAVRSKFVTLNPPQDGAYLSNMCIGMRYRQKGYGKELLAAAEQLTRLTAYRQIYLHNRWVIAPCNQIRDMFISDLGCS